MTPVIRGDGLAKSRSSYLIPELESIPNVVIRLRTELVDGGGSESLEYVELADRRTGAVERGAVVALFIMIGGEPHTQWLEDEIARDSQG